MGTQKYLINRDNPAKIEQKKEFRQRIQQLLLRMSFIFVIKHVCWSRSHLSYRYVVFSMDLECPAIWKIAGKQPVKIAI
jgi:hypothetical protein